MNCEGTAYIICLNDSTEFVILNDNKFANKHMENLKKEYWDKNKFSFKDYEEYETRCFWHIHSTKYID